MAYGSRQEDFGLAPVEQIQGEVAAARDRVRARVEAGIAPAAVDLAMSNGQILPSGAVRLSSAVGGIRLGESRVRKRKKYGKKL